jgi:GNAT superfamily N-acetyltransferase
MSKKVFENWKKYLSEESREIEYNIDDATIFGVVHTSPQRLRNWAEKEGVSEELIQSLEMPVAILKNIFVPVEQRGEGVGSQLMDYFIEEADKARTIILIADSDQSQAEGFNLVKWYESYGFEVVGEDSARNAVMTYVYV